MNKPLACEALLYVSFGGPEKQDDVLPFLDRVLAGKPVPLERKLEVAEHYRHFGGKSPITEQNLRVISKLEEKLRERKIPLKIYFGNRNWHPLLEDTLEKMHHDGIQTALAFFTSAYSSYSGCRQYQENIQAAQQKLEAKTKTQAPQILKLRGFFNHPKFIQAQCARIEETLSAHPEMNIEDTTFLFCAHSIPLSMNQGCDYEKELNETKRLVSEALNLKNTALVYQSRSGSPHVPWLEPDVNAFIKEVKTRNVVGCPIGFLTDHMEVLYDLDFEAMETAKKYHKTFIRVQTVMDHPLYIDMMVDLIEERVLGKEKQCVGLMPPKTVPCAIDCCSYAPKRQV